MAETNWRELPSTVSIDPERFNDSADVVARRFWAEKDELYRGAAEKAARMIDEAFATGGTMGLNIGDTIVLRGGPVHGQPAQFTGGFQYVKKTMNSDGATQSHFYRPTLEGAKDGVPLLWEYTHSGEIQRPQPPSELLRDTTGQDMEERGTMDNRPLATFYAYTPDDVSVYANAYDLKIAVDNLREYLRGQRKHSETGTINVSTVEKEFFDLFGGLLD